jgi:hypothetical protein
MSLLTAIPTIDPESRNLEPDCAAHGLSPSDRQTLAVASLSEDSSVSELSRQHEVSRKFVAQQRDKATKALEEAFDPAADDDRVLFYLPVTTLWLRQVVLSLMLIGYSSMRGVVEFFAAVFDHPIALGTVHNIMTESVAQAREISSREELSTIREGAHDEIFQSRHPILVGCDIYSTYCYLLAQEDNRDGTTWGVHLLDLAAKGLHPDHTIADGGKGLRAGQADAWPEVSCWGDHFHILQDMARLSTYVQNRAFGAMATGEKLERKMHKAKKKSNGNTLSKRLAQARQAADQAIQLADDITLLADWLREDILAVVGPDRSTREALFDWIVEELRAREKQLSHRIAPVRSRLENGREELLAFAVQLDQQLLELSQLFHIDPLLIRRLFEIQALPMEQAIHWQQENLLRQLLGSHFEPLQNAITQLTHDAIRASSVVENLNSRLRNYFFLRKQLGEDYLDLLRFFLNHRRFQRSEHPERVGKSPAEILTGKEHPHWLELLGFERFRKSA